MIVYKIVIFFLLFYLPLYAQNEIDNELIKKIENFKSTPDLIKIYNYYNKHQWDSTIVQSYKLLNTTTENAIIDYAHYFRGYGFKKKKLLDEALKEFNTISHGFPFHSHVKSHLGEVLLEKSNFKKALHYYSSILNSYDTLLFKPKKSIVYHNTALCHLHLKSYKQAENYLSKSNSLQEKEKDTLLLIGSYIDIANLYYEQYKDLKAITYFKKAYLLAKKSNDFELKKIATLNMAVVEENRKDFIKSLQYRKEYETWKDSLNNQNKVWAIAEVEKKYAVNQKQKEIRWLELENKTQIAKRNSFIASSFLLCLLLGTAVYFYLQKNRTNKIILSQKEDLNALNATKDKLFSIISHDLRSSVNTMQLTNKKLLKNISNRNYTILGDIAQKNAAVATSTYNLLENLLQWATLQTEQLYFNIESTDLFSIVEQVSFNYKPLFETKGLNFISNVPRATFVLADMDSLKMILRNLLDNAIKFSDINTTISIYTESKNDDFIYLVIEDEGQGMDKATKISLLQEGRLLYKKKGQTGIGTGLGLQLCKSMIKKNNGRLHIESEEGVGTKMSIAIPKWKQNG